MLTIIWAGIIASIIMLYVLFDGFDIGVGILFPYVNVETDRDILQNTVTPVWDGNETWLVLGAVLLYAVFPIAYGLLLPMLYMPVSFMLAAIILRAVAFEYRLKINSNHVLWNLLFHIGSIVCAFMQGAILGTFIQGFDAGDILHGNYVPWFTPFSIMTGLFVIAGYALLGATWLIIKTEGELQDLMYNISKKCLIILSLGIAIVSIWTPFHDDVIFDKWFTIPNILYLAPIPGLTFMSISFCWYNLQNRNEVYPFFLAVAVFVMSYIGLCVSLYPYIIPHKVTFWDAAAPELTQHYMLIGLGVLMPFLLGYSFYSFRVFQHKVHVDEGHH